MRIAIIDNGVVVNIIKVRDSHNLAYNEKPETLVNRAHIGFTFDADKGTDGAFVPPKPYPSWVLDETTCLWEPPVALPDGASTLTHEWDEEAGDWVAANEDAVE